MNVMTMAGEVLANGTGWGPGGWWPIFPIFWLLLWGTVIFFSSVAVATGAGGTKASLLRASLPSGTRRGEIAEEEYRERLTVLKGSK